MKNPNSYTKEQRRLGGLNRPRRDERFEDWSEAEHYPLELSYRFSRLKDGDYKLPETQSEWEAFKAGYFYSQNK